MKHFSHLNTAAEIISKYGGDQPFHLFIKDFFRQQKKYGSRDRKQITHLCYCYFRLGQSAKKMDLQEAIIAALFLCTDLHNELLTAIKPGWDKKVDAPLEEKCGLLNIDPGALQIFPFPAALSNGINANDFNFSHLIQPAVFLRIRPGQQQTVINKLEKTSIAFTLLHPDCISLPAATKIDELLQINKEVVIQDYNSQRTGDMMKLVTAGSNFKAWDCCAASGGKSIMAKDILDNIHLTVSDIRPAVLNNLTKRFSEAEINNFKILPADLSKPITNLQQNNFDLIIADVPCTGSGTWGRTPERLSFFDEKEITVYSQLQKKIITTAIPFLRNDGYFLYITCSVFKKENEDMVDYIQTNPAMQLIKMDVLKGYDKKADTMFAALFRKVLSI